MGYFSNGTEGDNYEHNYCRRCIHSPLKDDDPFCPVWELHLLHNYDECNKPDSFLHTLIPRTDDGLGNKRCRMFVKDTVRPDPNQADMFAEAK